MLCLLSYHSTRLAQPLKRVNDIPYLIFTSNRSTEYKMTTVTKYSVKKTNMSNEIKEMLADEYNIKTDDIDKEYQVERIKHMNERSNTKFTKQDKVLKTKDKRALENVEKNGNYLLDDNISVRKKLKKIHKIQENDPKKISFSSSQKTKKFDDNVKQIVLQKSNKIDIKSDKETVTALKIVKKMDKKQKHEKIGLKKIIKMLNKIIDKNEALLKQKNYSQSDLEKNTKKIRQLINQFLKIYYQYDAKKRLTKYENFNADKSKLKTQLSELEYEMRNIKLHNIRNSHDIFDSHSKINQLQVTTRKFETEFDNVKSQINQHDECKISTVETMKRIEKLEKKVALSKEYYVEKQEATVMADNQSIKTTDTEKFEIKDVLFQVASKVTVCIKEVTTLICDIFTFKDEEESFKETKPSNFMCLLQQFLQKAFAYTTEDLNNHNNTSKVNNVEESPNMTETPKIVYELSSLINELSDHEDTNKNFNEESPKILPSQVLKEKLNKIDDRKCECELIKQLGDTNMDNKLIDVEQGEAKLKETHDVIKTKKHDEVPEVDSAKHSLYSKSLFSYVLKDHDMVKVDKKRYKNMVYNPKSNNFELLEDKENIDFNCQSIRESSKSTLFPKSTKPLKSRIKIQNLPAKNAVQHHCNVSGTCTLCDLSKRIFIGTEN